MYVLFSCMTKERFGRHIAHPALPAHICAGKIRTSPPLIFPHIFFLFSSINYLCVEKCVILHLRTFSAHIHLHQEKLSAHNKRISNFTPHLILDAYSLRTYSLRTYRSSSHEPTFFSTYLYAWKFHTYPHLQRNSLRSAETH